MDQLLKSLGNIHNIQSLGGDDPVLGGADLTSIVVADNDLTRDVENVLGEADVGGTASEAVEDHEKTVDARVARCKERQIELESKFAKLQSRISALRGYHLGNHTAQQIQVGAMCCEKKLLRNKSFQSGETKENEEAQNKFVGGQSVSGPGASSGQPGTDLKLPVAKQRRPKVRDVTREQANQTYGRLYAHLKHVQKFADPDATESSSGGESADEHDKFNVGAKFYAPVKERAKYRYLQKRSEYARQWGWVQSQISDLEFKIRQQTEMYKAYRDAKGAVSLGEPHYQRNKVRPDTPVDGDEVCVRHRPVNRFKRRKLLDTYCLHHVNQKLNKPSGVNCSCLLPDEWCVLCFGKRHFRLSPDVFTQSRNECTALLDHSYHSVLSTQDSVPISTVLAEAAHKKRWLNVGTTSSNTGIPLHLSRLIDINEKIREEHTENGSVKRKSRISRGEERSRKRRRITILNQKEGSDVLTNNVMKEIREIKDAKELARIRDMVTVQDGTRKKRKNSFDIDHVVIPYNMSTTRVEKPKYKEIQTPSWREVDPPYPWPPMGSNKRLLAARKPAQPPRPTSEDADYEDVSVLAISLLHAKAEEEERIRWATPLGRVPGGQRTRANRARRLDSCVTEASSEANTPDPLSPGFIDRVEDIVVQTRPSSPQEFGAATPTLVSPAGVPGDLAAFNPTAGLLTTSTTVGATSTAADNPTSSSSCLTTAVSNSLSIAVNSTESLSTASSATASSTSSNTAESSSSLAAASAANTSSLVAVASNMPMTASCSSLPEGDRKSDLLAAASSSSSSLSPSVSLPAIVTCLSQTESSHSLTITPSGSGSSMSTACSSSGQDNGPVSTGSGNLNINPAGAAAFVRTAAATKAAATVCRSGLPEPASVSVQRSSGQPGVSSSFSSISQADSGISLTFSSSTLEAGSCEDTAVRDSPSLEDSCSRLVTSAGPEELPGSLKVRRRTSSQTYRSSRNRNLSEASQESSRCTSPGLETPGGGADLLEPAPESVSYEPRQFPLTDEEVKLMREEEEEGDWGRAARHHHPQKEGGGRGMRPPPPRTTTSLHAFQPTVLPPAGVPPQSPVAVTAPAPAVSTPATTPDAAVPTPPPTTAVSASGRQTPTPPASTATSRTTSSATSPSSSFCDEEDPDWEQEDDDSEQET